MRIRALIFAMHAVTIVIAVPVNIGGHVVGQIVSDAVKDCTGNCKIGVHGKHMISNSDGRGQIVEYEGKWKIVGPKEAAARDTSRNLAKTSVGDAIQNESEKLVYGSYTVTLPDSRMQRVDFTVNNYGGSAETAAQDAARNTSPRNAAQASAKDAVQNRKQDTKRSAVQHIAMDTAHNAAGDAI